MLSAETRSSLNSHNSKEIIKKVQNPPKKEIYKDLIMLEKLSQDTHTVHLALSLSSKQKVAVKMFPEPDDFTSGFMNHVRFMHLNHPNIVTSLSYQDKAQIFYHDSFQSIGYIVMEYSPYSDFHDIIYQRKVQLDEKLVRTFFRQMIYGVQYLHSNEIAHLNIRPSNMLLGADLNVKLTDFSNSYHNGDVFIQDSNSKTYRAPELVRKDYKEPRCADIYALGVILFLMKSEGIPPFISEVENLDMERLIKEDPDEFWKMHEETKGYAKNYYNKGFRKLFEEMIKDDPRDRATLCEIILSDWFNGDTYNTEELRKLMKKYERNH